MSEVTMAWVDLETTGLDPEKDHLLEVAVVLTDDDLNEVDHFASPIRAGWRARRRLKRNGYVWRMHTESGLVAEVGPLAPPLRVVVGNLKTWFLGHGFWEGNAASPVLAGSSVHFDRAMLKAHAPSVESLFHYRNVDVSTLLELHRRWTDKPTIEKGSHVEHRALADVRQSIRLATVFRNHGIYGDRPSWLEEAR